MSTLPITHYAHRSPGNAMFVKEAEYFIDQGGLIEPWGKAWRPIYGASSLEEARRLAEQGWDLAVVPEKSESPGVPALRSVWRHKNGNLYRIEALTNVVESTVAVDRQIEYPTTVVYSNIENGKWYSRQLARWHGSMTLYQEALPTVDQISSETAELISWFGVNQLSESLFDRLRARIEYIARGAALRSFQDGIKQEEKNRQTDAPFRPADIERALMLFRTGNSAHGYTNVNILSEKVDNLPAPAKAELATVMRNIAHGLSPIDETDPLLGYLRRQWEWSLNTFGPAFRTAGIIEHIRKELGEVEKEPHDLMEWLDIVILALDGYWRHGGSPERALALLQKKQDKNFARNWPDWRTMSENQAIEHDRSEEKSSEAALAC